MEPSSKEYWKQIGKALKKARVERGLTQHEVAELTGVSHQAISQYENGKHPINDEMRQKLQKECGIIIAEIAGALASRPNTPELPDVFATERSWGLPKGLLDHVIGTTPDAITVALLTANSGQLSRGDTIFVDTTRKSRSSGTLFAIQDDDGEGMFVAAEPVEGRTIGRIVGIFKPT